MAPIGRERREHPILHLEHATGNQAVQWMLQTNAEELEAGLTGMASARFGHDFSRIPIQSADIQTKLAIDKPEDRYEQEADRVSEAVIRITRSDLPSEVPGEFQLQDLRA